MTLLADIAEEKRIILVSIVEENSLLFPKGQIKLLLQLQK